MMKRRMKRKQTDSLVVLPCPCSRSRLVLPLAFPLAMPLGAVWFQMSLKTKWLQQMENLKLKNLLAAVKAPEVRGILAPLLAATALARALPGATPPAPSTSP